MLARPEDNLFIVGDDDQSIYHFRGARPELMLNFTKDYPEAETVLLDINYRCSGHVLSSAMEVIGNNKNGFKSFPRRIRREKPVACVEYDNPKEQAMEVVRQLRSRLDLGEALTDTAVLFETNQEAELLVGAVMEYQVLFV